MSPQPTRVTDPDDPRLSVYRDLKDPHLRHREGLFVAESPEVVRCLVRSESFAVHSVLLAESVFASMADCSELWSSGTDVFVVPRNVMGSIIGMKMHRGALAAGVRPPNPSLADLLTKANSPLWVGLGDVSDPDNIGTSFRNAAAFGCGAVILSPASADPLYRKATRTSMGATLRIPFMRTDPWPEGLQSVQGAGFTLCGLTPDPSADDLDRFVPTPNSRLLLLCGNEGFGLSPETLEACDVRLRIPMADGTDSLNAATATGIALHRLSRVLGLR